VGSTKRWIKDPNAVKDYTINWVSFLGVDTIASSAWTVPTGITKDSDSNTTTTTTIWLSGGTASAEYSLINRITTAGGVTEDITITIAVEET